MTTDEQQGGPADPAWTAPTPELPADVEVEHFDPGGAPPPRSPRSHVLTGVLVAIAVAAVFVIVGVVVGSGKDNQTTELPHLTWSSWKPSNTGDGGAQQVAAHVAPQYREGAGQLVVVQSGPLEVAGVPLTVAQRDPASAAGGLQVYDRKTVLYRLCGQGANCAIAHGAPSVQRHMLLRREALELGLYSLRYLDGVDQVVVFMPPRRGGHASQALFFRKPAMLDQLQKPLETTLVDRAPTVARMTKSPDAGLVQQLTIPALFRFHVAANHASDRALLVLEPIDLGAPVPAPGGQPATSNPYGPSLS